LSYNKIMLIYIGADHRGFNLKETIKKSLKDEGYEVVDVGNNHYDEKDDYPDFAKLVAQEISKDSNSRGILICGSGVGVDIVANKFKGVRSALVSNSDQAYSSRNDDDANVLSLAADFLDEEQIKKILSTWLATPFANEENFRRRLEKIRQLGIS
jgi:ribose 5-phosphate isomerase B